MAQNPLMIAKGAGSGSTLLCLFQRDDGSGEVCGPPAASEAAHAESRDVQPVVPGAVQAVHCQQGSTL